MATASGYRAFLETHRTKLDHKTILAYEETRDVFPGSFLGEPAENVTPAMFRKLISERTKAPVMQNRHLSRLKAAIWRRRLVGAFGQEPERYGLDTLLRTERPARRAT